MSILNRLVNAFSSKIDAMPHYNTAQEDTADRVEMELRRALDRHQRVVDNAHRRLAQDVLSAARGGRP